LILLFLPALYAAWFRIKSPIERVPETTAASLGTNFKFARIEAPRAGS
jgi:hypothetical protein